MSIELIREYNELNKLDGYLQSLTDVELINIKKQLDDCSNLENKEVIVAHVNVAISNNLLKNYIDVRDAEFISKNYNLPIDSSDLYEIKWSLSYLTNIPNIHNLFKWCPMLLYLKRTNKIYEYLQSKGSSEEEIAEFLFTSFDKCILLSNSIQKEAGSSKDISDDFIHFINKVIENISSKKSGTESYDLYIEQLMEENEELLKRLS